jgi:hypothetical protein
MKIHALRSILVALVISLSLAPAALAGTSTGEGYRDTAGNVQQQVAPAETSTPDESTSTRNVDDGTLPFTGLEIAFIGMAGIALLGLGLGLRLLIRRQPTAS